MNWKRITLVLLTAGLISGGYYWWRNQSRDEYLSRQDVAVEVFGNQQNFDVFLSATNVTVQRVHFSGESKGSMGFLNEFGFTNSYSYDAPLPITVSHLEEIRQLLKNPRSYEWNSLKGCMPEFGMAFHFHSASQIVSVAFCFNCRQLVVFDTAVNPAKRLNIEEDFDPIKNKLVAIAKEIFPEDPEIQKLK